MSSLAPPANAKKARASDVRRRAVLPTTLQNLRATATQGAQGTQGPPLPADEFLDKVEEELNRKLDLDLDTLVDGMAELVKVHQVRSPRLLCLWAPTGRPVGLAGHARGRARQTGPAAS